eukprot:6297224-Pyramimonas_sp.AAC.1
MAPVAWVPSRPFGFAEGHAECDPQHIEDLRDARPTGPMVFDRFTSNISGEAWLVLGALWGASGRIGLLSRQLACMLMPMPPKARGGHGIIILYSASYREHISSKYWGAASGRSAIDSAWILASKTESNVRRRRRTATVIADNSRYPETRPLEQARDRLVSVGAETAQRKLVFNQWR